MANNDRSEQSRVYDYEAYFNPELELLNSQFEENEKSLY
jgi:hypothetical protein